MQDLEPNTKATEILCPECSEKNVVLHMHPHKYAGIFSCETEGCGASWSCEHPAYHEEDHEVDTVDSKGEHTTYPTKILVCDDCGVDCTDEKTIHYEQEECEGCS